MSVKPIFKYISGIFSQNTKQHLVSDNSTYSGETEIFRNRLILGTLVLTIGYFYFPEPKIIISFTLYLGLAVLLWITQIKNLLPSNIRLSIGLLFESSMGYYLLSINSEGLAFIYPIYLWTILGNGFRFGIKWLALASICTTLSFSITIYTQAYWQQNLSLSLSLLFALIIIPAYCASLIKKLSLAKEKAEAANKAKSYFLAGVSHELRTPLNAIIGYGSHLKTMNLSPSQFKMVESSVSAGQYLLQLIEQLLQLGKSDSQSKNIENKNFNAIEIISEIRDILSIRYKEKGLELLLQSTPECEKTYYGPETAIKNLLLNITNNAIKFTDNGKIIIRSSIKKNNENLSLELSITDTGIGIGNEACDTIFEPFQQADETIMERFGGTGLGLAICRQICEEIDAHISVKSEIGVGSVFTLLIPIETPIKTNNTIPVSSDDDSITHIISLGEPKEDLLLQAQSSGKYYLSHHDCNSIADIKNVIQNIEIDNFNIVILDQSIVGHIDSKDEFWDIFKKYSIACVLISGDEAIDIHKINLQAAFSSILPPIPNFDQFRQAINIGTSFIESVFDEQTENNAVSIDSTEDKTISNDTKNQNSIQILVVDDNRTNRMVLESILLSAGYQVTLVNDGDEALEKLEQETFDIMLIDVNMPRLNGIEATKLWRLMEKPGQSMPIVGVTADATDETLEKCLAAGMNERMTKPVEAEKLILKVKNYCQPNPSNENENSNKNINLGAHTESEISNISTNIPSIIDDSRFKYLESIGDNDFIKLVIDSYIDETYEIRDTLYVNGKCCNIDEFRFAAHAIKSSANNIGATGLSEICKAFETLSENDFQNNPDFHIEKLITELKKVEENILAIKEYYQSNNENSINQKIV